MLVVRRAFSPPIPNPLIDTCGLVVGDRRYHSRQVKQVYVVFMMSSTAFMLWPFSLLALTGRVVLGRLVAVYFFGLSRRKVSVGMPVPVGITRTKKPQHANRYYQPKCLFHIAYLICQICQIPNMFFTYSCNLQAKVHRPCCAPCAIQRLDESAIPRFNAYNVPNRRLECNNIPTSETAGITNSPLADSPFGVMREDLRLKAGRNSNLYLVSPVFASVSRALWDLRRLKVNTV